MSDNGQPQQPLPPGMTFNIGNVGNRVMLQIVNTMYLTPVDARGLIATLRQAVDDSESAVLVTGVMPPPSPPPRITH